MSITESIVIGIISGILTSIAILIGSRIFNRIVLPWYQSLIYSGILVEGQWYTGSVPNSTQEAKLELDQYAHRIKGIATYTDGSTVNSFSEKVRTFKVSGTLKDRFVLLTLEHTDRKRIGVTAYLLEVVGDGRIMKGGRVFYNVSGDEIKYSEITFKRDQQQIVQVVQQTAKP